MEENKNLPLETTHCDQTEIGSPENCQCCYTSTELCIRSRYCFMTGEYCSKQSNIQYERKKLYDNNNITAFVIMNFSDMSDVVYNWRIKTFIESLTQYLYINKSNNRLYCSITKDDNYLNNDNRVKKIKVIRSDSEPASNYVICSRICQQIQIADLIIVDVSSQNANVFYEFGMAVALGKMILPICYSESYYKMVIPKIHRDKTQPNKDLEIKRHIGCYPWRKDLFEYYGIRYKYDYKGISKTEYLDFDKAVNFEYKFPDIKYNRFPYHELYKDIKDEDEQNNETNNNSEIKIGQVIYDKLKNEYNNATYYDNTLVVYTIDTFLNGHQAGLCIVNFYRNITARMNQEKCFCGERVGVLVQENVIPENEKDAKIHSNPFSDKITKKKNTKKNQKNLFYNLGEIIQIGLNQATYLAAEDRIKSNDNFTNDIITNPVIKEKPTEEQMKEIKNFVKSHIKNRGIRVYPNNPVFVDRMRNLIPEDLLDSTPNKTGAGCDCCKRDFFCLYHVMLKTLRYTNEIVVDISNNCLQSLFWLGAAHGSDVYAVTVLHEKTDMEKKADTSMSEQEHRYIFDVAGLWTAIFRKNDTDGFYRQLASVQYGIERHSKLTIPGSNIYRKDIQEHLFAMESERNDHNPSEIYSQKQKEENFRLESYYQNRFWASMLNYNRLRIYISQKNERDKDNEPKLWTAKWDFDAVSRLSHYLSKRTVIGEYTLQALPNNQKDPEAKKINFISVGSFAQPVKCKKDEDISDNLDDNYTASDYSKKISTISDYICEQIENSKFLGQEEHYKYLYNIVHKEYTIPTTNKCNNERMFKGFQIINNEHIGLFTQQPQINRCSDCEPNAVSQQLSIYHSKEEAENSDCHLKQNNNHYEIAQLILWRESSKNLHEHSHFWVSISGCSGPATSALSCLFVDKEQQKNCLGKDADNLLCELQSAIRKRFMDVFSIKLQKKLDDLSITSSINEEIIGSQKERYINLVKYAVAFYLNTVLYRYFFPFLSEQDIDRIYNGMYTFVNSMKAAKTSPFSLDYPSNGDKDYTTAVSKKSIKEVIKLIPELLISVLKSFRGLEAFYLVDVTHQLDRDPASLEEFRTIKGIQMMKKEEKEHIICFFI